MNLPSLQFLPQPERHEFQVPAKKINEGRDVSHFLSSKAYSDIMKFLLQLNRAMFPRKLLSDRTNSSAIQLWETVEIPKTGPIWNIQALLGDLAKIIDEVPLDTGPRRFGNVSFRKWHQRVEEQVVNLLQKFVSVSFPASSETSFLDEIKPYFLESFGSPQRLDYGSGHELSFLAFLGCIWKVGGFSSKESLEIKPSQYDLLRGLVFGPIQDYLTLIRRLIKTYTLEPAGSHGVWGLDDHSFIPYIFGSAQYGPAITDTDETPIEGSLIGSPDPADVTRVSAVNRYRQTNFYFAAIGFIHDVKTGPFHEHSPMLYDISGVQGGWGKINKGMIKMYNAEVLSKFPVVQHFPFGSLFSWETDPSAPLPPTSIHASSQPFSLNTNAKSSSSSSTSSVGKAASSRPTGQESTKAPRATPTPSNPPTARTSRPPTTTPPQESIQRRHPPPPNSRQPDPSNSPSASTSTTTMRPPPTRAPWAK